MAIETVFVLLFVGGFYTIQGSRYSYRVVYMEIGSNDFSIPQSVTEFVVQFSRWSIFNY